MGRETILMDNVAFHKSRAAKSAMIERGFVPMHTSPYSPEWNAAELIFSLLKRRHRVTA